MLANKKVFAIKFCIGHFQSILTKNRYTFKYWIFTSNYINLPEKKNKLWWDIPNILKCLFQNHYVLCVCDYLRSIDYLITDLLVLKVIHV